MRIQLITSNPSQDEKNEQWRKIDIKWGEIGTLQTLVVIPMLHFSDSQIEWSVISKVFDSNRDLFKYTKMSGQHRSHST